MTQNHVNSTIVDGRAGILRITLDGNPVLDNKGYGIIGDTFPMNLTMHTKYAMGLEWILTPSEGSYGTQNLAINDPEFVWTQKVVPTELKFLTSEKLGSQYHNDIFVGAFSDGRLYHFALNQDRSHLLLPSELSSKVLQNWNSTGFEDIVLGTGFGGKSSMNIGPDGFLYVVSVEHGKVYRIIRTNN